MSQSSLRTLAKPVCSKLSNFHEGFVTAALSFAALCILVCANPQPAVANAATTTTALAVTSSGSAVTAVVSGNAITLTATVSSGSTTISPGQVDFCDATAKYCTDIHLLGVSQLTSAGTATLKFVPGIGVHSYKAVFLGTGTNAASSSAAAALTVTGTGSYSTTTSITQSGSTGNYSLTAIVSGNEPIMPTGNVSFQDTTNANFSLGSASLASTGSTALPSFVKSSSSPTNPYPQAVAVADFNGDGKADLAIPVYSISTPLSDVSILLGNGDGTFTAAPVTPITGQNAGSVTTADFNGDGKPDLAITLPDAESVQVMLGNGDGTFAASQTISDPDGPFFVTTGDFNGDGIADLAVVNPSGENLTIFLGNGNGTFTEKSSPASGGVPVAAAVGDFNGDGKADLAVANYSASTTVSSNLTILLGNGDGTFTAASESPAVGNEPLSITVGDFNGDGKADLAVANSYVDTGGVGSVTVLMGNGDGTFTPAPTSPATGSMPYSIAVGDVNGDGIADLVTSNVGSNDATVLLGKGDGTFEEAASPATGADPLFLALGDFNGDGLADLAAVNNNTSSATVLLSQLTETATASLSGIAIAGAGSHLVDASYQGDANYAASISGTVGLTAQPIATTLTLSANPASTGLGQQVVLTAALAPSLIQNHAASGSVTFSNGSTSIGSGTLSSGVATLNLTSLPLGADSLTATYAGDANFGGSMASPVTETVIEPDYSIASNPTSLTIQQGASGTVLFTITPVGGFSQSVALACSGLPANSTCTFSPATVSPNGSPVTSTLTIATNVNTQAAMVAQPRMTGWLALAMPIGPAGFAGFLGLLGIRSKNRKSRKGIFTSVTLIFGAALFAAAVIGCVGGGAKTTTPTGPITPTGTSTVTVTATSATGGSSHSATVTVVVAN